MTTACPHPHLKGDMLGAIAEECPSRAIPAAKWSNETPGGWNDVLPLLSKKNAAKGE